MGHGGDPDALKPAPEPSLLPRLAGEAVLAFHLTAAAATVWPTPRGFPVSHPRFWLLGVVPLIVVGLSLFSLAALLRGQRGWSGPTLLALAAAWAGLSGGASWLFPISSAGLWP